jgi:hypothetical protein
MQVGSICDFRMCKLEQVFLVLYPGKLDTQLRSASHT